MLRVLYSEVVWRVVGGGWSVMVGWYLVNCALFVREVYCR